MKKELSSFIVTLYLIFFLVALCYVSYLLTSIVTFKHSYELLLNCIIIGGFGGTLYCLRGIYINYCVVKKWSNEWMPWYFIRPIVSLMCGGISYLFLKAGLLVLEAKKETDASI